THGICSQKSEEKYALIPSPFSSPDQLLSITSSHEKLAHCVIQNRGYTGFFRKFESLFSPETSGGAP
ncbi:MAG: hypothetical protein LBP41_02610, partial [Holosporaceae bacterium]|nr:hypothetical protein [Holosporaceae bacterium]